MKVTQLGPMSKQVLFLFFQHYLKIYAYVPILDNNVIHGLRPLKSYSETDREIFS